MTHPRTRWSAAAILFVAVFAVEAAQAQRLFARPMPAVGKAGPGGMINLPYFVQGNGGAQWVIYQGGMLQQQGNQSLYSQGCQLSINGVNPAMNNNQGRLDEKTGELVLENMNAQGLLVTRRILIDKEKSLVRYIDIIKNPGAQPVQAQVQVQSNFNFGVNATQNVADPKRKGQDLAWVGQNGAGPSVMEIYGGKGSKNVFTIRGVMQNSYVQAVISPTIPAGKEVALMHLHGIVPTVDAGVQYVKALKEAQLLRTIPKEIRKILVNFVTGQNFIGDVEILRGDMLDVVELKGGDQYKGTLKEPTFSLDTFYGKVELPVTQVIGLINVGRFRPRQLVITADGQIFGGRLAKDTLELELSSKQVIKVPLAQVSRVGYRKRDGEPEEWTFDKPMVLMRSGERVAVKMPTEPLSMITRYGKLMVKPETIAMVMLQSEEHGVHELRLTDGSRFAGLLEATGFPMKLENASAQEVTFPASSIARMQFTGKVADPGDDAAASLTLANDDVLVGRLGGKLAIETAFDTIGVNAEEVRSLTHPAVGSLDVSLTLWDGTTLSGQLQDQELACQLASGLAVRVPVALLQEYQQPQPAPSAAMKERIKTVVGELNADDWKARDRAEASLVAIGPVAIAVLKDLRAQQPPEAQQRIDSVVKELTRERGGSGSTAAKASGDKSAVPAPELTDPPELEINIEAGN